MALNKIFKKVSIVGGTHGNELTGIFLVKKWLKNIESISRPSFDTKLILANVEAIDACRRYIETDLNRCFSNELLNSSQNNSLEERRAKEINTILGPKGSESASDIILDLHNTTANMDITLIYSQKDAFTLGLLSFLSSEPLVKLYYMPEAVDDSPYLPSVGKRDICIEVGAQPHGTLLPDKFFPTEKLVINALDYIESHNNGNSKPILRELSVYTHHYNVDYPRDESGQINAMIHPELQGSDYMPLHPNAPMFITFDGESINYDGKETVYPVFINEKAYYEKQIAFSVTTKTIERF